jgi:outer membrane protein insertion porin family
VLALVGAAGLALGQGPAPAPATAPPAGEKPAAPDRRGPAPKGRDAGESPEGASDDEGDVDPALIPFEGRPVRDVVFEGLNKVNRELVMNQIRVRPGQPLSPAQIRRDVQRLTRLGVFREINARVRPFDDGTVNVVFALAETKVIQDVQVTGNREIAVEDLRSEVDLLKGQAADAFQLDRAARRIKELYRKKGYYLVEVEVDQKELEDAGTVLFIIRERERIKVTDIRFEGNRAFTSRELRPEVKTKVWGIFETGPLDDDQLEQDVQAVIQFYKDRGYLDVRADRVVRPSPDQKEAVVTFVVDEGQVYTLRSVKAVLADPATGKPTDKPPTVHSVEQIAGLMEIKAGDVYSIKRLKRSVEAVQNAYGTLGYVDAKVIRLEQRDPGSPQVDLLLVVREGQAFKTGVVSISGNELTQQKVVRRQIAVKPERPLDTVKLDESRQRIEALRLFDGSGTPLSSVKTTIQPEDPANPGYRDVLVEVKETNTGSVGFSIGVTSDRGLIGELSLQQKNFDVADVPDSLEELIKGRAFRGAGQNFRLSIAPGTDVQNYSVTLGEPHLFETDYSTAGSLYYRVNEYDEYDDNRYGGTVSFGRIFGERWVATVPLKIEHVELSNIDSGAPVDVFEVADPAILTSAGLQLTRKTTDSNFRPTKGTHLQLGVDQIGALGGDYTFTRFSGEHVLFLPVYEDFLGYTTVLSFKTQIGYIPQSTQDVPTYERFYMGGRNFRGFKFRTVSPKGIRNDTKTLGDDPVGGTWKFFFGTEVTQPVYQDIVSVAAFIDTGTVTNDPWFNDYRVSIGAGLRLFVPQLSPIPFAFDFAVPILKQDGDEDRLFSFSLDLPF